MDFLLDLGLTLLAITVLDDLRALEPGMVWVALGFAMFVDIALNLPTRPLTPEERRAYTGEDE